MTNRSNLRRSLFSRWWHRTAAALLCACSCLSAAPASSGPAPLASTRAGERFDIRAFGALGDGKANDALAINRAITAAAAAGGGIVHIPPGDFVSASIHLKSHVTLELARGATLIAASKASGFAYDLPEPNPFEHFQDFGHGHWHDSLIWSDGLSDVAIIGQGIIRGDGLVTGHERADDPGDKAIALKRCRGVHIAGITILNGGHIAILATGVDDLSIDHVRIDTDRDGIDIDCCHDVRLDNCRVNAPRDDGVCFKSSYALGEVRATENVRVTSCTLSGYWPGQLGDGSDRNAATAPHAAVSHRISNGRLKFGTESNGGLKHVVIRDCHFEHCAGLAFETVDGGDIEDIRIDHIDMRDVSTSPLFLRLGARLHGPGPRSAFLADANLSSTDAAEKAYQRASRQASKRAAATTRAAPTSQPAGSSHARRFENAGHFRRIIISNMTVTGAESKDGIILSGIEDHPIEQVTLRNIRIEFRGGGHAATAAANPPELETVYPEPSMFDPLPAYGLFARHVRGLDCDGLIFKCARPDARPPIVLEDVTDRTLKNIQADHP